MQAQKLTDLHSGKQAVLADFEVSLIHQRLLSMGFLPGAVVRVMRRLPWKGNLYVEIEGRHIALRYSEASHILVTVS